MTPYLRFFMAPHRQRLSMTVTDHGGRLYPDLRHTDGGRERVSRVEDGRRLLCPTYVQKTPELFQLQGEELRKFKQAAFDTVMAGASGQRVIAIMQVFGVDAYSALQEDLFDNGRSIVSNTRFQTVFDWRRHYHPVRYGERLRLARATTCGERTCDLRSLEVGSVVFNAWQLKAYIKHTPVKITQTEGLEFKKAVISQTLSAKRISQAFRALRSLGLTPYAALINAATAAHRKHHLIEEEECA